MEKIPKYSSWNLPATDKQVRAITQLCIQLGYHEPYEERKMSRLEARNMIMGFREEQIKRKKARNQLSNQNRL